MVLLADGLDRSQFAKPPGLELHRRQIGLGPRQAGQGTVVGGAVSGRVNHIQGLPGLDVCTFHKLALLDDAANLRPHLGNLVSGSAPGQLGRQGQGLRLHHDVCKLGRACSRWWAARWLAASGQHGRNCQGQCPFC